MGAGRGEGVAAGAVAGPWYCESATGADAVQRPLERAADGAGVERVLGDVVAAVDAGEHQVGRAVLEDLVQAREHAVGGRALDGEAPLAEPLEPHRAHVGDRVRDAGLLEGRRHHPDLAVGAGELAAAISSATASPGALMPSSLVRRMRMPVPSARRRPFLGTGRRRRPATAGLAFRQAACG